MLWLLNDVCLARFQLLLIFLLIFWVFVLLGTTYTAKSATDLTNLHGVLEFHCFLILSIHI